MLNLVRNLIYPLLAKRYLTQTELKSEIIASGLDLENTNVTFEYFLNRSGFKIEKEIFSMISQSDFIEIYDKFGIQMFRTFNLYKYSSFSEDDFYKLRMDQMYDRPVLFHKMLVKTAMNIFSKKIKFATNFCPDHIVKEKKLFGTSVEIGYKFMAPLFDMDHKTIVGVVVCEKIKTPSFSQQTFH